MVVPILAPKITEMACGNDIKPALTKPIAITVVADDDCRTAVTRAPARTPLIGLLVNMDNIFFIFSQAAFCNDSLIWFIPNKKIASPPVKPKMIFNVSLISITPSNKIFLFN